MKFTLEKDVQFILDELNKNGTGFLVGGAIRDILLGEIPDDYDFATDIDYDVLKRIFKNYNPKEVGAHFGILMININDKEYEIAKFRKEIGIYNSRYPKKIKFVSNIREDLVRRDFTINSLAYNNEEGLINLFDGVEHIKKGLIKFVGNPKIRIEEDALRIMRAFRFVAKLGFSIDRKTSEAIYDKRKFFNKISKERIFDELSKILMAPYAKDALKEMKKLGILEIIIPEYRYLWEISEIEKKDIFKNITNVMEITEKDLILRLSVLFYKIGKVNSETIDAKGNITFDEYERESSVISESRLKNLKVSNKIIESVKKIILYHRLYKKNLSDKIIKKILLDLDNENLERLLSLIKSEILVNTGEKNLIDKFLNNIKNILAKGEIPRIKDIDITGVDLINLKFEAKDINKIKEEIHDLILEEKLRNDKEDIVKYIVEKYNLKCPLKYEKSCGAVIYNKDIDKYLLVKMKNGNWGFAKGHMEEREIEEETAIREVKEETNVDIKIGASIREVVKYIPKEDVFKEVVFFLGFCEGEINIILEEEEIEESMWCNYEEAQKNITYKVQRDVLEKVNKYVQKILKNKENVV